MQLSNQDRECFAILAAVALNPETRALAYLVKDREVIPPQAYDELMEAYLAWMHHGEHK